MHRKLFLPIIVLTIGCSLVFSAMALAQVISQETREPYSATVETTANEARIGEPFFIQLSLDPATPPPGYFISTLVDVVESPKGAEPEILTGCPKIRLTMVDEGLYRILVRISLVTKSSCGGVDAQEILTKEVQFKVVAM